MTVILVSIAIHAFAIYVCGALADFSEGWKKPHIALLVGGLGAILLLVPQILMMVPASGFVAAHPSSAGVMLGNGLATLWYFIAFAKFYEFGCGGIMISLLFIHAVIQLSLMSLNKML